MNTSEARAELAVLNAFRQLGISVGDRVKVADLERQWSDYGLRALDFDGAVARLSLSERLKIVHDGAQESMVLTQAGDAWSREQSGLLEYALLVPRRVRTAAQRRAAGPTSRRARSRETDRVHGPRLGQKMH